MVARKKQPICTVLVRTPPKPGKRKAGASIERHTLECYDAFTAAWSLVQAQRVSMKDIFAVADENCPFLPWQGFNRARNLKDPNTRRWDCKCHFLQNGSRQVLSFSVCAATYDDVVFKFEELAEHQPPEMDVQFEVPTRCVGPTPILGRIGL